MTSAGSWEGFVILSAALVSLRPYGCLREDCQPWRAETCALRIREGVTFDMTLVALLAEPASVLFPKKT